MQLLPRSSPAQAGKQKWHGHIDITFRDIFGTSRIATGHDGDVRRASLTVDHNGAVFIAFGVNDRYNYANPTAVEYGYEFYFELYCANNSSGSWSIETVYQTLRSGYSDNFGSMPYAMLVDGNNDVHLFTHREGWWNYGGTAWDYVRSASSGTWNSGNTMVAYSDTSMDRMLYGYFSPVINSSGLIMVFIAR